MFIDVLLFLGALVINLGYYVAVNIENEKKNKY